MVSPEGLTGSERIVGYCDQCDVELGPALPEYLGRRIQCPRARDGDYLHLARVVRIPGWRWLSVESQLLRWQAGEGAGRIVRRLSGSPRKATGGDRVARLGLVALAGVLLTLLPDSLYLDVLQP